MEKHPVRVIVDGDCYGRPIIIDSKISFFGEIDPEKGVYRPTNTNITGRPLVFRGGRGSTVGSYIIYGLKHYGKAPSCLVVEEAEPVIIVGCILADIPLYVVENYNLLLQSLLDPNGEKCLVHRRGTGFVEVVECR